MAGRKPLGPALVSRLDGSSRAKERLELILATIAGKASVVDAAERLGISEAMFYKLRNRVLQTALVDLEPKPMGRPGASLSSEAIENAQLSNRIAELQRELASQTVRLELAQIMAQPTSAPTAAALKKTTQSKRSKRQRRAGRRTSK